MLAILIDSHPVFLNGLTQYLSQFYKDIQILRSMSPKDFETNPGNIKPELIILGVNNFFKKKDIKAFDTLTNSLQAPPTIIFYDDINMITPFLKSSVNGFLSKNGPPEELIECVETVMSGRRYINNEVYEWIVRPNSMH